MNQEIIESGTEAGAEAEAEAETENEIEIDPETDVDDEDKKALAITTTTTPASDLALSLGELPRVILQNISLPSAAITGSLKMKVIKKLCLAKAKLQVKNTPFGALFCTCFCGRSIVTEESITADDDDAE